MLDRDDERIRACLLKNWPDAKFERHYLPRLQEKITAYFEGTYVEFGPDVTVRLDAVSRFSQRVLQACRDINYSQTTSYGKLAEKSGSSKASRAVGRILAANQVPLIIPCHRVTYADGRIGGFSAAGGTKIKKKMLQLEQASAPKRA